MTSSVFYDAVFIGSANSNSTGGGLDPNSMQFVEQAYMHQKPIGALGSSGSAVLKGLGINGQPGVYSGDAGMGTTDVLNALSGPVRFPQRFPTDDVQMICG